MSYIRLSDYKNTLDDIIGNSIPEIIETSTVYSQVNELIYLTEKLNKSKTHAFRRLTYKNIVDKITYIKELGQNVSTRNIDLLNKLSVIQSELVQLNSLISDRLIIQNKIEMKTSELYELNNEVTSYYRKNIKKESAIDKWQFDFESMINLTYQSLTLTKLSQLRQNINILKDIKKDLYKNAKLSLDNKSTVLKYAKQLEENIFLNEGLLSLKVKQLIINGRARGRGNFLNNLVKDFSTEVEFSSFELRQAVIKDAKQNSKKIKNQINYMVILFVFALLCLVTVIYYINNRVVSRLLQLNKNMKYSLSGEKIVLEDKIGDEISQIVDTFNYYRNKVNEQKDELEQLSLTDQLTSIANRRALDLYLEDSIKHLRRDGIKFSILLMDIDYFKLYNDYYGHLSGDTILKKVAKVLKRFANRDVDLVARYGGEEFVCILHDTDNENAIKIANKIVTSVESLEISHEKSNVSKYVTISIGVYTAEQNLEMNSEEILKLTDKLLYKAKQDGRNRYVASF